jgi:flagellar biosynthesis/type III secretory pathway protein FliH
MDIADINISKSIIKKKKVFYLNDQYLVHSGAGKIVSDFTFEKEKERLSEERALQALSGNDVDQYAEIEEEIIPQRRTIAGESGLISSDAAINPPSKETTEFAVKEIPRIEIDYSGVIKQEYDKGVEAGKKSAVKFLENEFKKKLSVGTHEISNLMDGIKNEFEEYKHQFDKYIITLSIAIAEKIVKHEIILESDIIIMQIKDAINKVLGVENITIHINPEDEEMLRMHKNEIMNKFDSIKELHIHANDKIERGGCKIESQLGNVDARISTQLKIIEDALLENIKIKKE